MKKKEVIKLSIITANYNQADFLDDYFSSITNSTIAPSEIIFVDDGSTDNSLDIVKRHRRSNLKIVLISLNYNSGFTNALNIGIKRASEPIIMRLDPDDFILPTKIEEQYNFLINNKEYAIVGTNAYYFNDSLKKIVFKTNLPASEVIIHNLILSGKIPILHSSIMGWKNVFLEFPYIKNSYPAEDYYFLAQLVKNNFRIINLEKHLMFYRLHVNNISLKCLKRQINKKYEVRNILFNKRVSKIKKTMDYLHTFFYRKALVSNKTEKYFFFLASIIFNPVSFFRRIPLTLFF